MLTAAVVVFLTSLSALPVSYTLNSVSQTKDFRLILLVGFAAFAFVTVVPHMVLRSKLQKADTFFYVLGILTFSSVMSLILALENDGLIAQFMGTYLREIEPYLKTAHGTMSSYWDGIAHYALYLMMLAAASWNQSFYDVGLYWVGSFGHSTLALGIAVAMSKNAVPYPFLLRIPHIIICAWAAMKFLKEKRKDEKIFQQELESNSKDDKAFSSIFRRPWDIGFILYFIFAGFFTVFRFVAVVGTNSLVSSLYADKLEPYLKDPLPFPKAQMMIQLFYFVPYYAINIGALLKPGQSWVPRWALIHAGAAGQAQVSFMGSSFHYRTPYIHRLPQTTTAQTLFWLLNGLLFTIPQLYAYRCLNQPQIFLHKQLKKDIEPTQVAPLSSSGPNSSSNGVAAVKKNE